MEAQTPAFIFIRCELKARIVVFIDSRMNRNNPELHCFSRTYHSPRAESI